MKVILSRKGFDGGYGGFPSPILPDGRMISLPIPDKCSSLYYSDVHFSQDVSLAALMQQLFGTKISIERQGKVKITSTGCHLDPDIDPLLLTREPGWCGLFGQDGTAQTHLVNQGVTTGDLFLFFGWFRKILLDKGRYCYSPEDKTGAHVLYGYFEVDDVAPMSQKEACQWMRYHPHVTGKKYRKKNNTLYVARKESSLIHGAPGSGMFCYNKELRLTREGYSRSKWTLPSFFKDLSISYHSERSWKDDYFQSAPKGQEFVIEEDIRITEWAKNILRVGSVSQTAG